MTNEIIVLCPHCELNILVMENEIACAIFRHGTYKQNFNQINPHEKKEICEKLVEEDLIHGCGKPFRLIKDNNEYTVRPKKNFTLIKVFFYCLYFFQNIIFAYVNFLKLKNIDILAYKYKKSLHNI
jgi:hypothetical protein